MRCGVSSTICTSRDLAETNVLRCEEFRKRAGGSLFFGVCLHPPFLCNSSWYVTGLKINCPEKGYIENDCCFIYVKALLVLRQTVM